MFCSACVLCAYLPVSLGPGWGLHQNRQTTRLQLQAMEEQKEGDTNFLSSTIAVYESYRKLFRESSNAIDFIYFIMLSKLIN